MDQFGLVDVAEPCFDLVAGRTQDAARLCRAVVDQPAGDLARRQDRGSLPLRRARTRRSDRTTPIGSRLLPSRASARTAPASSFSCPRTCRWSASHCLRAASVIVSAIELRADRLAAVEPQQHVGLAPRSDDGVGAAARPRAWPRGPWSACRRCRYGCRRRPPCAPSRGRRPGFADQRRIWMAPRIAREQAGLIGEDHQRVGFDQDSSPARPACRCRRNLISSIATVSFSLITGIVFSASSVRKRRARVQIAAPIGEVLVGEQDLRGMQRHACGNTTRRPAPAPSGRWRRRPAVRAAGAGRRFQPSRCMPSAIAPDDTSRTSRPWR